MNTQSKFVQALETYTYSCNHSPVVPYTSTYLMLSLQNSNSGRRAIIPPEIAAITGLRPSVNPYKADKPNATE